MLCLCSLADFRLTLAGLAAKLHATPDSVALLVSDGERSTRLLYRAGAARIDGRREVAVIV